MRLLLSRAEAVIETDGRGAENQGNAEQGLQRHMAFAALELLPMARGVDALAHEQKYREQKS